MNTFVSTAVVAALLAGPAMAQMIPATPADTQLPAAGAETTPEAVPEPDPATPPVGTEVEPTLTEDEVRQLLEDEGYTEVSDLRRDNDTFHATAEKDGQEYSLEIDAVTGEIEEGEAS